MHDHMASDQRLVPATGSLCEWGGEAGRGTLVVLVNQPPPIHRAQSGGGWKQQCVSLGGRGLLMGQGEGWGCYSLRLTSINLGFI